MATTIQFDLTPPTEQQLDDLKQDLSDEERHVLLEHGTEAPFCGLFLEEKRSGVYTCRLCGLPLFHGGQKFNSGTGWPSFTTPFAEDHLKTIPSWYVVAKQDRALNPDLERFYAKRMGAKTSEIDGSHFLFLSHPVEIARVIEEAAAAASK